MRLKIQVSVRDGLVESIRTNFPGDIDAVILDYDTEGTSPDEVEHKTVEGECFARRHNADGGIIEVHGPGFGPPIACPKCGDTDDNSRSYSSFDCDDNTVYQRVGCNVCDYEWTDAYEFDRQLSDGSEDQPDYHWERAS